MKRPAFQFFPGDWQRDAALRSCSVAARGLWIEMMCIMHDGSPYGHLALSGTPIAPDQLARMVGAPRGQAARWTQELEAAGVFSRDPEGRIFSRRMVRDERTRNVRAEAGKLGGNPVLLNLHGIHKDNPKDNHEDNPSPTLPLTPAVAVAFASASSKPRSADKGVGHKPARRATPCPDSFDVSEDMASWAVSLGVPAEALKSQTEKFLDHHRSKGTSFRDWTAAWRTWMRNSVEFARRS